MEVKTGFVGYIVAGKITREVIWSIYGFWLLHIVGRLFYHNYYYYTRPILTYKWRLDTFQIVNVYFDWSTCQSFQLHVLEMATHYHLTSRNQNFTLAICTLLKLITSNKSSWIALCRPTGVHNSGWPNCHFVALSSEQVRCSLLGRAGRIKRPKFRKLQKLRILL